MLKITSYLSFALYTPANNGNLLERRKKELTSRQTQIGRSLRTREEEKNKLESSIVFLFKWKNEKKKNFKNVMQYTNFLHSKLHVEKRDKNKLYRINIIAEPFHHIIFM